MQLVLHYELLMAYQWNKSWWHFIEIRWKDVCNIHSYSVPNKVKCANDTTRCNTECFVGILPSSNSDKSLQLPYVDAISLQQPHVDYPWLVYQPNVDLAKFSMNM